MRKTIRRFAIAVVLMVSALLSVSIPPDETTSPERVLLDEPRQVAKPTPDDAAHLCEKSRRIRPAMMFVGHPKGDWGTAFVISKKHRLLATNAHVAEILNEVGAMIAVPEGSNQAYSVEKIWFHPDYARAVRNGVALRKGNRWVRLQDDLSPDFAVMQLSSDGPELDAECLLGEAGDYENLASQPVGLLGFSGVYPPPGQSMRAVFRAGTVSLLTDFAPLGSQTSRWKMVDFGATGGPGDSGGPIFSKTGRVVAVFGWGRADTVGLNGNSVGIRIDGLWELLDHYGLRSLIVH